MPAGVIAVPGLGIGASQPDEVVARRPRLRIAVRPSRRRVAGIAFASATVTLLALFAAAVFQTVLVQGQQRLDRLDRRVSQAQDRFDRLRKQAHLLAVHPIVDVVLTVDGVPRRDQDVAQRRSISRPAARTSNTGS